MVVTERLELAVGPGIQDPVLHIAPGGLCLVLSLVPIAPHLGEKRILACSSRVLGLDAFLLEVLVHLGGVPVAIRGDDVDVPVLLHELLELPAVGRGRVGHVMVREPPLELRLVPFVIGGVGEPRTGEDGVGAEGQREEGGCDPHGSRSRCCVCLQVECGCRVARYCGIGG